MKLYTAKIDKLWLSTKFYIKIFRKKFTFNIWTPQLDLNNHPTGKYFFPSWEFFFSWLIPAKNAVFSNKIICCSNRVFLATC